MKDIQNKRRKILVFDFDGTISNFKEIDSKIIFELFSDSSLVKFLDKILWWVNEKDIIRNSMLLLKLRILVYSFISATNFYYNLCEYKRRYFFYSCSSLRNVIDLLEEISKTTKVIVLSNNSFTRGIACRNIRVKYTSSKKKYIKELSKHRDIPYMIGNNLSDDILVAKFLKIKSIYVGKSFFVRILGRPSYSFYNIEECLNFFKEDQI